MIEKTPIPAHLKEAIQLGPSTIGVFCYDDSSKYAIVQEQGGIPVCYFATAEDFEVNGLPLPNVLSDRVLELGPSIQEVTVHFAEAANVEGDERDTYLGKPVISATFTAHIVHDQAGEAKTQRQGKISLNEQELLQLMYGKRPGSSDGIASLHGEGRGREDMIVLIEREVSEGAGREDYKRADIVFFTSDQGESSIAGALQFIRAITGIVRNVAGSDASLQNMWEVVDVINSLPANIVSGHLVAAHLIAEELLMRIGMVKGDDPKWKLLRRHIRSFSARLAHFFAEEQAIKARREDVGRFVQDTLQTMIVDDYRQALEEQPEMVEERDVLYRDKEILGAYKRGVQLLEDARGRLVGRDIQTIQEVEEAILEELLSFIQAKTASNIHKSNDAVTLSDIDVLEDCERFFSWLIGEHRSWWLGKKSLWIRGKTRIQIGEGYFLNDSSPHKPYNENQYTLTDRRHLAEAIHAQIEARIGSIHTAVSKRDFKRK
ncbi:MAG: hypothetical protein WC489_03400 [Patescibacteria group bacterium]